MTIAIRNERICLAYAVVNVRRTATVNDRSGRHRTGGRSDERVIPTEKFFRFLYGGRGGSKPNAAKLTTRTRSAESPNPYGLRDNDGRLTEIRDDEMSAVETPLVGRALESRESSMICARFGFSGNVRDVERSSKNKTKPD